MSSAAILLGALRVFSVMLSDQTAPIGINNVTGESGRGKTLEITFEIFPVK